MKKVILTTIALCGVFLWMGIAVADNITIYDNRSSNTSSWYGTTEDQEVEPGMQHGQRWDLEGFFLNGNILSVVGGFDFVNGVDLSATVNVGAGDIFIDIDCTALYGNAASGSIYDLGWDYVFDVDWEAAKTTGQATYDLYALAGRAGIDYTFEDVYGYNSPESSPYRLDTPGAHSVLLEGNGVFSVSEKLNDTQAGFIGGDHYKATGFDLTPLFNHAGSQAFLAHLTEKCGNDNLIGKHPVSEPSTMLLLGVGLVGLAGIGRKKFKK